MVNTSDISKIKLLDGSEYDLKDGTARQTASGKLNAVPGVQHAGKYMVVSSTGEIVPETKSLVTASDLSDGLAGKVDKMDGKGLSANDFSDIYKSKLDGIDATAQVNVIEEISVNGTALTPDANKAVNIQVPSAPATMSSAEAIAGSDTTGKLVSAKTLDDAITHKGYTANAGTVTGVTMNNQSLVPGADGVIDIGTVLTQAPDVSGKQDREIGTQYNGRLLTVSGGNIAASDIATTDIVNLTNAVDGKVAITQGLNKAGRYMVVNQSGDIEPQEKDLASTEYANGLVQISSSEPQTSQTKIWINPSASGEVSIPTMDDLQSALSTLLDCSNFSSSDAGKFLVINSSGQVVAVTMQQWQAGSY